MRFNYKKSKNEIDVNADGEIKEKLSSVLIVNEFENIEIKLIIRGDPELVLELLEEQFRVRNPKDQCNAKFTKAKQQKRIEETLPTETNVETPLIGDVDQAVDELDENYEPDPELDTT